jgi:hypothetical protein
VTATNLWLSAGLALVGLLGVGAIAFLAGRVRGLRRRLDAQEQVLASLRGDLEAIGSGSLQALQRLDRVEPALERLAERVGTVELGNAPGYEQAIEAASRGASAADLTGRYGLSAGEADLVVAVHRPRDR